MVPDRFIPTVQGASSIEYSQYVLQDEPKCRSSYHEQTRVERAYSAALTGRDPKYDKRVMLFSSQKRKVTVQRVINSFQKNKWNLKLNSFYEQSRLTDNVYNHCIDLTRERIALCGEVQSFSIINLGANVFCSFPLGNNTTETVSAAHWTTSHLATIGTTFSFLDFYDCKAEKFTRSFEFNRSAIRVIDHEDPNTIYVGFNDGALCRVDRRSPGEGKILQVNTETISSLAINRMIAVGNDANELFVYDPRNFTKHVAELPGHHAAVTALNWMDRTHLISGEGSSGKCLRFWCMHDTKAPLMMSNTRSQVTGIHKLDQQTFVSTHGFLASNSEKVRLWSIRDRKMVHVDSFTSPHRGRIISSAMSKSTIITGSGEKPHNGIMSQMCVWNINQTDSKKTASSSRTYSGPQIR